MATMIFQIIEHDLLLGKKTVGGNPTYCEGKTSCLHLSGQQDHGAISVKLYIFHLSLLLRKEC